MMNIQTPSLPSLSSLRLATHESAASRPAAGPAPASDKDPAGFASLLRQTQAAASPAQASPARPSPSGPSPTRPSPIPRPADAASDLKPGAAAAPAPAPAHGPGPDPETTETADTDAAPAPQPRARASTAGKPRPADPAGRALRNAKSATGTAGDSDIAPPAAADKTAVQTLPPVVDALPVPTATPWLAELQRNASSAAPGAPGAAGPANTGGDRPAAPAGTASALPAANPTAEATLKDNTATADAPADANASGALFAQALTEQRAVEKAPAQPAGAGPGDAALAAGATFAPNPATGIGPAGPVTVTLATPVAAPAFAQELGVRMSVLARDGVQRAELHLNPADMGPVSVQIVMDGSQARVDFGADVAATRAAIEAGLPALASALREAGFTLTGGGVTQHSRGRGDGSGGGGASDGSPAHPRTRRIDGSAIDDAVSGPRHTTRRTVSPGGLDLYA